MNPRLWLGMSAGLALAAILAAAQAPLLYLTFSAVCHQLPARCLIVLGHPLPVCARCLGLYAGALAAALRPLRLPPGLLWALAAMNAADAVLSVAGNQARLTMALAFAWPAGSWLVRAVRSRPAVAGLAPRPRA